MPEINPLPVSSRTREKLQEVKSEGESYDDLLQRLVLTQHRYDLSERFHEVAAADLDALHDLDDLEPEPYRDDTPEEPAKGVGRPAVGEDPTDRHTHREGPGDPDTSDQGPEGDSSHEQGDSEEDDSDAETADDETDVEETDDAETADDDAGAEAADAGGDARETDERGETDETGPFGGSGEVEDDE